MMTFSEMVQTDIKVSCFAIENIIRDKIESLTRIIKRIEERNDGEKAEKITRDVYSRRDTLQGLLSDIIKYRLDCITKEEYNK